MRYLAHGCLAEAPLAIVLNVFIQIRDSSATKIHHTITILQLTHIIPQQDDCTDKLKQKLTKGQSDCTLPLLVASTLKDHADVTLAITVGSGNITHSLYIQSSRCASDSTWSPEPLKLLLVSYMCQLLPGHRLPRLTSRHCRHDWVQLATKRHTPTTCVTKFHKRERLTNVDVGLGRRSVTGKRRSRTSDVAARRQDSRT